MIEIFYGSDFSADYIRFGSGKKNLIIIPGLSLTKLTPYSASIIRDYSLFEDIYTVYLFDRRNNIKDNCRIHDFAEDIYEAIIKLGLHDADIIGISQGGMIALDLLVNHPEQIGKAVICSCTDKIYTETERIMSFWYALATENKIEELYSDFCEKVYSPAAARLLISNSHSFISSVNTEMTERFMFCVKACYNFHITGNICPDKLMVFGAEKDVIFTPSDMINTAKHFGCKYKIFNNSYHAVYDENKDFKFSAFQFFIEK